MYKATFVYGDRKKPAGTAIPNAATVLRHKKIFATAQDMEEGDNMAVKLMDLDPDAAYMGKAGATHGGPSVLYAMSQVEPNLTQILDDIDVLNNAGMCPGDIPARALTISRWVRAYPNAKMISLFPLALVVIDNDIHGGWAVYQEGALEGVLANRANNRVAYGRWLLDLLRDLSTTDTVKTDA